MDPTWDNSSFNRAEIARAAVRAVGWGDANTSRFSVARVAIWPIPSRGHLARADELIE